MALSLEEQINKAREEDFTRQQNRDFERQYEAEVRRQQAWYQQQQAEDFTRQQEQQAPKNKPISLGFFLLGLLLSLIADGAEIFTLGTIGWIVGVVVDLILLAMFGLSKAGRGQFKKFIWAPIIETIPVLNIIPARTASIIWTFMSSRSKTLSSVNSVVS